MKKLLFFVSITVLVVGCQNDNDPSTDENALFAAGTWRITSITADPGYPLGGQAVTDLGAARLNCVADDRFVVMSSSEDITQLQWVEGDQTCSTTLQNQTLNFDLIDAPNYVVAMPGGIDERVYGFDLEVSNQSWELVDRTDSKITFLTELFQDDNSYEITFVFEIQ